MTPEQAWQTAAASNESYFRALELSGAQQSINRLVASGNRIADQRDLLVVEAERRKLSSYKYRVVAEASRQVLFELAEKVGLSKDEIKLLVQQRFGGIIKANPYDKYTCETKGGVLDSL